MSNFIQLEAVPYRFRSGKRGLAVSPIKPWLLDSIIDYQSGNELSFFGFYEWVEIVSPSFYENRFARCEREVRVLIRLNSFWRWLTINIYFFKQGPISTELEADVY